MIEGEISVRLSVGLLNNSIITHLKAAYLQMANVDNEKLTITATKFFLAKLGFTKYQ